MCSSLAKTLVLVLTSSSIAAAQYAQTTTRIDTVDLYVAHDGAPPETVQSTAASAQPTLVYNCKQMPAICANIDDWLVSRKLELPLEFTFDTGLHSTARNEKRQKEQCSIQRFRSKLPCTLSNPFPVLASQGDLISPEVYQYRGKFTNVIDSRYDNVTGEPVQASGLMYTCNAFPSTEWVEGGVGEDGGSSGNITCAPQAIQSRCGVPGQLSGEFQSQHVDGQKSEVDWQKLSMKQLRNAVKKVYGEDVSLGRFQLHTVAADNFLPRTSRAWVFVPPHPSPQTIARRQHSVSSLSSIVETISQIPSSARATSTGSLSSEAVFSHSFSQNDTATGVATSKSSLSSLSPSSLRSASQTLSFVGSSSESSLSSSATSSTSSSAESTSTGSLQFDIEEARRIIAEAQYDVGNRNQWFYANPRFNTRAIYEGPNSTATIKKREQDAERPGTGVAPDIARIAALLSEAEGGIQLNHTEVAVLSDSIHNVTDSNSTTTQQLKKRAGSWWMETISHNHAKMSFNPDSTYKVWRNVRDYGAVGNGVADDTAAINKAITDGQRCGAGCGSSSITGAIVYLPAGTYKVSSSIIQYYYTQIIGDATGTTTIVASNNFVGLGVISSDVYIDGGSGSEWYINQNNFYRQIRNLVIDTTLVPEIVGPAAIHWQVAQATSLQNIQIKMPAGSTNHTGIFMENGSGGFFSDISITGGYVGMFVGNQQFTTRNLHFSGCNTAIRVIWNWGWTWKSLNIRNCKIGLEILPLKDSEANAGSVLVLDSTFLAVGVAVSIGAGEGTRSPTINLENLVLQQVTTVVQIEPGTVLLGGGGGAVTTWGYGHVVSDYGAGSFLSGGNLPNPPYVDSSLKGGPAGGFYERAKPQYENVPSSNFVNVIDHGVGGAGASADDHLAINNILQSAAAAGQIVYFPAGTYFVQDTIQIPAGSVIVGEAWSQIMAVGSLFSDPLNPKTMVNVGKIGDVGSVEIQDMLFTTGRNTAGAILMQWNIHESTQGSAAMWDCHFRVGGAKGTTMQKAQCPKLSGNVNPACAGASMLLHMTSHSSGYFENVWAWTADHDLDDAAQTQIDIYSARGILIESQGPTWLYGTASEHNTLYQYQLVGAQNIFMGMIQTESPYYQGLPAAPYPFQFSLGQFPGDPFFLRCLQPGADPKTCAYSWGLRIVRSLKVYVLGAGLYSWFQQYDQTCVHGTNLEGDGAPENCQQSIFNVIHSTQIFVHNLMTKGVIEMVSPWSGATILSNLHHNTYVSTLLAWYRNGGSTGNAVEPVGQPGETVTLPPWIYEGTTYPVSCIFPCVIQYPPITMTQIIQPPPVTVTVGGTQLLTVTPSLITNPVFSVSPYTVPSTASDPLPMVPTIIPVISRTPIVTNGHTVQLPPLTFPLPSNTDQPCYAACQFPVTTPTWTLGNGPALVTTAPDPYTGDPTATGSTTTGVVGILPRVTGCVGSGCSNGGGGGGSAPPCTGPACNICNNPNCYSQIQSGGNDGGCVVDCLPCIGFSCQGCFGPFCPGGDDNISGSDDDDGPTPTPPGPNPPPPPPDDNPNPPKGTTTPDNPDDGQEDEEEEEEDEEQCTLPGQIPSSLVEGGGGGATYTPPPSINTGTAIVDGTSQSITPAPTQPAPPTPTTTPLDTNTADATVDCYTGGDRLITANRAQMLAAVHDICQAASTVTFDGDPDKQVLQAEYPYVGDLVIDVKIQITNYACVFTLPVPSGATAGDAGTVCGDIFRVAIDQCDTNGENAKHGGTVHTNCAIFLIEANPYKGRRVAPALGTNSTTSQIRASRRSRVKDDDNSGSNVLYG